MRIRALAKWFTGIALLLASLHAIAAPEGVITKPSKYSVRDTMDRLEEMARRAGATVHARIDYAPVAVHADSRLRPRQILILTLGNALRDPVILDSAPLAAIDLPLKLLVWEETRGQVWVSYSTATQIKARHGLHGADNHLAQMDRTLKTITDQATR